MTNKINGIDVSECDYFEKQYIEDMYESDDCNVCIDNFCTLCWKECEKYNGCYFKQLKRLQEKNEELKARFNELYNNAEQLANKYNKYDGNKKNELVEIINKTTDERNKYKQALEEIKDIAQIHQYFNPELLEIKGDIGQIQDLKMTEIFKKCNEVLNDRN